MPRRASCGVHVCPLRGRQAEASADSAQSLHVTIGLLVDDLTFEGLLHAALRAIEPALAPPAASPSSAAAATPAELMHAALRAVARLPAWLRSAPPCAATAPRPLVA